MTLSQQKTGTVKWFDYKKGYGFIVPDEKVGDKDVFVHISALKMANIARIEPGQRVIFTIYQDRRRTAAYISQIL